MPALGALLLELRAALRVAHVHRAGARGRGDARVAPACAERCLVGATAMTSATLVAVRRCGCCRCFLGHRRVGRSRRRFPRKKKNEELVQEQLLRGVQQMHDPWGGMGGVEGEMAEFGLGPREMEMLQRQMEEAMEGNRRAAGAVAGEGDDEWEEEEDDNDIEIPDLQELHHRQGQGQGQGMEQGQREGQGQQLRMEDLQTGTFVQSNRRGVARLARREVPRLDYGAPLMQLLLQSFFMPWFQL